MATVAQFTVPSSDFPLGRVFDDLPNARIELERIVPTKAAVLPYFWVRRTDGKTVLQAIDSSGALRNAEVIDEIDQDVLVRTEWIPDADGLVDWFAKADVTLLSAVGTTDGWTFDIRVEDPATLSAFREHARDHAIAVTVKRLRSLADVLDGDEYGLTAEQEESLLLALDAGYYEEPREVTLADLAADLGITRQSLSSRLRRGYKNLIESTIDRRR